MTKTADIIKPLRLKAAPMSYFVMSEVTRGVVLSNDRNILVENNGHLNFIYKVTKVSKKMVSRLGNTTAMLIASAILSKTKLDFQHQIKHSQEEYNIPDDPIINFDQALLVCIF